MKLLIVDDEKLTREGIEQSIDFPSLSISQVLLADDGQNGLKAARKEQPDIVLTDVRMPRMNGVEMAERILEELPDTVIVFMSAYSDKEYLKAAIKLKAVSYVEKPLDTRELTEALKEAVASRAGRKRILGGMDYRQQHQLSFLASLLMEPEAKRPQSPWELIRELNLPFTSSTPFCTMILRLDVPLSSFSVAFLEEVTQKLFQKLTALSIGWLYTLRADQYVIFHIYSASSLTERGLSQISSTLIGLFQGVCHFYIARGPVVSGPDHVPDSALGAWKLLEQSFFFQPDSEILPSKLSAAAQPAADVLTDFSVALSEHREEQAIQLAQRLYRSLSPQTALSPSQIRDLYYRYLGKLDESATAMHISLWNREGINPESIWDGVMGCLSLSQLNELLTGKIRLFFSGLSQGAGEHPLIFQIKEFIHRNYSLPTLSVPDVSSHVHLSSSYMCTLFKSETGQTLNQYLTDYRIRMSKQLLADPRYKIADISSKVGYSDGNYYSKAFKKLVGLSPSEYREKMLS